MSIERGNTLTGRTRSLATVRSRRRRETRNIAVTPSDNGKIDTAGFAIKKECRHVTAVAYFQAGARPRGTTKKSWRITLLEDALSGAGSTRTCFINVYQGSQLLSVLDKPGFQHLTLDFELEQRYFWNFQFENFAKILPHLKQIWLIIHSGNFSMFQLLTSIQVATANAPTP